MTQKCVHKGCGKAFEDEDESCVYHPGPPIFHEGQKGWRCCKPRVLTYDEFLEIPPCTTGKHSTVDDTPAPEPKEADAPPAPKLRSNGAELQAEQTLSAPAPRLPAQPPQNLAPAPPAPPESDSDEPDAAVPPGLTCKRRGCNATSDGPDASPTAECVYHPGQALFHEGTKGWTCCKKRVLEFDEFMNMPGCKTRKRHCFIGKKKKKKQLHREPGGSGAVGGDGVGGAGDDDDDEVERLATVRNDFYQTPSTVHASFYLKKIEKDKSKVVLRDSGEDIELDLRTSDGKVYTSVVPLYAKIDPGKSSFRILGTKLELTLAKADGAGWPVLRNDEKLTGEIIQTGRAGRA